MFPLSKTITFKDNYIQHQDPEVPLPSWRPPILISCKHHDLTEDECYDLKTGEFRNPDSAAESQKDTYHLSLLTLKLGNINGKPCIGGHVKFPSWIRKDPNCVVLPYLVFRNGAGPVGGIARHQHIVRDHAVLGMVVHAEITAPPVAVFGRGTHEVGSFVDLLGQRQYDTEQKTKPDNKFWIIHGCIFRSAFGQVTSGEMVDTSSGIRTTLPDCDLNLANEITPHPAPLASTRDDQDWHISEIQGKESVETCELLKPISGADNHDARRLGLSEVRVAVSHISSFACKIAYAEACERWVKFIASCISHQVDFIQGDGSLFAQRNFKREVSGAN